MTVLIYQDYIHNNGCLHRALCEHYGPAMVRYCDASNILSGCLDEKIRLFVMPGGADLYYCEKLNGTGNAMIRQWVENGGAYLGICAGAYYACAEIEWAKGTDQEIAGPRELAFFPGKATGPVMQYIEDGDIDKSWLAAAPIRWRDDTTAIVCYEAGPVFEEGQGTALARYADLPGQPPAIVECAVGKGRAVLCSPHVEHTAESLKTSIYKLNNQSHLHDQSCSKALIDQNVLIAQIQTFLFQRAYDAEQSISG